MRVKQVTKKSFANAVRRFNEHAVFRSIGLDAKSATGAGSHIRQPHRSKPQYSTIDLCNTGISIIVANSYY